MANLKSFLGNKIIVTQLKGCSKLTKRQIATLIGVGLGRRVNKKSEVFCSPSVLGMLKAVEHLVRIDQK